MKNALLTIFIRHENLINKFKFQFNQSYVYNKIFYLYNNYLFWIKNQKLHVLEGVNWSTNAFWEFLFFKLHFFRFYFLDISSTCWHIVVFVLVELSKLRKMRPLQ